MQRYLFTFLIIAFVFQSCSKDDSPRNDPENEEEEVVLSTENFITLFQLTINGEVMAGDINQNNNSITFETIDAELNNLNPTIEVSPEASVTPEPTMAQNFNENVQYVVEAEDGRRRTYTVIVNNTILSSENFITSFTVSLGDFTATATIDNETNSIYFEGGTFNVSSVTPTIQVSDGATISPEISVTDFTDTVEYTVMAENGEERLYTVTTNKPRIEDLSTVVGRFTGNPILLYTGAEMRILGAYIYGDNPNAKLYLSNGTETFDVNIIDYYLFGDELYIQNVITVEIPFSVPTDRYNVVYELNGEILESEMQVDIQAENSPIIESSNRELYQRNDVLIFYGRNLPDMIAIPSNGNLFLVENSNNYDLTVNAERTELRVTLDYGNLFPSYYGREDELKIITPLGPNRRAGKPYRVIFD